MWWIRNHKLFIGPQWMGHILWLSIPSCQWRYNGLCSWTIWWLQHLLTTKRLSVELNARALYLQFSWELVPSKLTPTDTTDYCRQGFGHTGNRNCSVDSRRKSIWSTGYVCGVAVASRRENRAVFGAELSQNKYLTYAPLIQVQLPDSRIGE